jgi:iron complex transport system substrate-binding protein
MPAQRLSIWLWALLVAGSAAAAWSVLPAAARVAAAPAPADPDHPRIVALVSGVVDTLDEIGAMDRVVAVGGKTTTPSAGGKARIHADERGGMTSAEGILALRPDYVYVAKELMPPLAGRGLNVVRVPQDTFPEMREFVLGLGRVVRREEEARAALDRMDAKMADIRRRVAGLPRPRVYYEEGAPGRTRGPGTAIHEMIELAGGENVYRDARIPRPTLCMETVVGADPEVIVLGASSETLERLRSRPGWSRVSAVRTGRVYVIPESERSVTLYAPRCAASCERTLLRWIHPELFPDGAGGSER